MATYKKIPVATYVEAEQWTGKTNALLSIIDLYPRTYINRDRTLSIPYVEAYNYAPRHVQLHDYVIRTARGPQIMSEQMFHATYERV